MVDIQYSLADVAKITGKSEKTISRWIKSGKLPAIRHGTGYLIDEKDVPLKLGESVNRHEFIQKQLLQNNNQPQAVHPVRGVDIHGLVDMAGLIAGGQVDIQKQKIDNINLMLQKHQSEVEKIIREQNELAEKYARATYKIGQLEERNRLLEGNNSKLEQKMSLLPLPEQWSTTQQEMTELKQAVKEKELNYQKKEDSYLNQLSFLQESLKKQEHDRTVLEHESKKLREELEAERTKGFWLKFKNLFS